MLGVSTLSIAGSVRAEEDFGVGSRSLRPCISGWHDTAPLEDAETFAGTWPAVQLLFCCEVFSAPAVHCPAGLALYLVSSSLAPLLGFC